MYWRSSSTEEERPAWPHELNLDPCLSSVSRVSENGQTLHDAFDTARKSLKSGLGMAGLHWFKGSLGAHTHIDSHSHLFNIKQNETHSKQHLLKEWTIQIKIPEAQVPTRLSAIKAWPGGCFMGYRGVTALCSKQGRLSLASCTSSGPSHQNCSSLLPGATGTSSDIHWSSREPLKLKCRSLVMLQ